MYQKTQKANTLQHFYGLSKARYLQSINPWEGLRRMNTFQHFRAPTPENVAGNKTYVKLSWAKVAFPPLQPEDVAN